MLIFCFYFLAPTPAKPSKKTYDLNTQADAFLSRYAGSPFPEAVDANEKELAEVSEYAVFGHDIHHQCTVCMVFMVINGCVCCDDCRCVCMQVSQREQAIRSRPDFAKLANDASISAAGKHRLSRFDLKWCFVLLLQRMRTTNIWPLRVNSYVHFFCFACLF